MSGSNFAAANLVPLCIEPSGSASAEDSVAYIIRRINGARIPKQKIKRRSNLDRLMNWATRIRTWKMLESESSALPFGDSAITCIIIADCNRFVNSDFKVFLLISQSDLI